MTIGVLKEMDDSRVSLLPDQVESLIKQNLYVYVETEAGSQAFARDEDYFSKNAVIGSRLEILQAADILLTIHPTPDFEKLRPGTIVIGVYQPLYNLPFILSLSEKGITLFSLDMLPRITRAQSMDVLSSQANIAGYKAVLMAANIFPCYFPMFMTAAGSIAPAKVLILGAGVAGLQAIATARRLGAVVEVFDTRPAVKDEVKSLGAKFIEVEGAVNNPASGGYAMEQSAEFKERQQQRIAASVAKSDIVITTAQIPGKKAPVLITETMLQSMKPGSVIIDLAAATGGNTAMTENNQTVCYQGVTIVGNSQLPSGMPLDASKMYGRNILNFLKLIVDQQGVLTMNFDDEIIKESCILYEGNIVNEKMNAHILKENNNNNNKENYETSF